MEGDTPEAIELAEWLRARVGGRSLRQLEGLFPHPGPRRTQWSEFLRGRKLIPSWLLDDIVIKLVPPQDRQLHRGIGHELRKAAEQADAARLAAESPTAPPDGTAHDFQMRLENARQGQFKARETVQSLTHLIYVFISVMADLNQRCKNLETERDQARLRLQQQEAETTTANQQRAAENKRRADEDKQRLAETERRLAETERRHAEFEERLARARREQQEAEDLRIAAFQQAEQNRRVFKQLTGQDTPVGSSGEDTGSGPAPQPWEYDHLLETADAQLDSHDARMDTIREQIGFPAPPAPDGPRTIPGQVVPTPSTDSADNAPAPGGTVPTSSTDSADSADSGSGTAVKGHSTLSGTTNQRDREVDPPAGGTGPQTVRSVGGRRMALAGTCLALLAVGGWLAWDQLNETRGQGSASPGASAPSSSTSPSPEKDDSLALLKSLRDGTENFVIGVKENQPGLSMKGKNDQWSGSEIAYARLIAEEMGIPAGKIIFKPLGTPTREEKLKDGTVHIIVGTYGISPDRKKEVDFAGPYYQTDQKVLLRRNPKVEGEAQVRDESGNQILRPVRSLDDLNITPGIPLCTVKGSTAHKYLATTTFKVTAITDYADCVNGLLNKDKSGYKYDGLATDEIILAGFAKAHGDKLMITRDGFDQTEKYGIGLKKDSPALKHAVCEAMKKITDEQVKEMYKANYVWDGGESKPLQVIPEPTECETDN
ncbi:transporter substrate-binding domain-containing protein [Streptomyces sp. NPDC087420]|uniref:transporter substrate-binding domain-containing protein n=1 Tax=Streptomyces sp. NPDC087420 TaxID=3365785 RepID=UPI0038382C35